MRETRITRNVKVGEPFEVEVLEAVTSGYLWVFQNSNQRDWKLLRRRSTVPKAMGEYPKVIYQFEVLKPGHIEICADLKRPWEEDQDAQERLVIDINAC